ncbi:DarT ssDNA thymidine ADP-ribosyltransferase family protein [Limosilactobacillus pontis]|uniref:DarT ssDNA thymidine ADP-ribosyltransferase family protein n=1 Tax=Limosilactobacillus pontis TaxID=35787 RepID=UPI00241EAAB6|nr:DarT ssDNA thymidine ADP-ribosyltransferase family protein [Limosilactobacillus pontis]
MTQASTINVYRLALNNRYGWVASVYPDAQFDRVIHNQLGKAKWQSQSLTAFQQALLACDPDQGVRHQLIGTVARGDQVDQARLIVRDLRQFAPDQVLGQTISSLYFYGLALPGTNDSGVALADLRQLMQKYPQVQFGWPADPAGYRQQMAGGSSAYAIQRARALKHWFDQGDPDLAWLYAPSPARANYQQAFAWLKQNAADDITSWYYDQPSATTGMIWHFTDINNMANILSYQEITSKNWGTQQRVIENDNAASSVNDAATKPWVHDYARFYLRPKTPTQYRNEGIYQYYGDQPDFKALPKSLVNRAQTGFWTDGLPAHLPVPVFIGFSLRKFLQQGGHLVKGSLAGKRVADEPAAMFDDDCSFLKEHVQQIYSEWGAPVWLKHTEFVFPQRMHFNASDILRIVVRSEAEKLVLLTLLTEHDSTLFSKKGTHQQIDVQRYIDRIVVDPRFFYYNGSTVQTGVVPAMGANQYQLGLQPTVAPANLTRQVQPFGFTKEVNGNQLRVAVPALKQVTLQVRDVNGEVKPVARFHDPDWILGTNEWIPTKAQQEISAARGYQLQPRYYSALYYHGHYYKLWRAVGSAEWHLATTNEVTNVLAPADRATLKRVEESFSATFADNSASGAGGLDVASTPANRPNSAAPAAGTMDGQPVITTYPMPSIMPGSASAATSPASGSPVPASSANPASSADPVDDDDDDDMFLLF